MGETLSVPEVVDGDGGLRNAGLGVRLAQASRAAFIAASHHIFPPPSTEQIDQRELVEAGPSIGLHITGPGAPKTYPHTKYTPCAMSDDDGLNEEKVSTLHSRG